MDAKFCFFVCFFMLKSFENIVLTVFFIHVWTHKKKRKEKAHPNRSDRISGATNHSSLVMLARGHDVTESRRWSWTWRLWGCPLSASLRCFWLFCSVFSRLENAQNRFLYSCGQVMGKLLLLLSVIIIRVWRVVLTKSLEASSAVTSGSSRCSWLACKIFALCSFDGAFYIACTSRLSSRSVHILFLKIVFS